MLRERREKNNNKGDGCEESAAKNRPRDTRRPRQETFPHQQYNWGRRTKETEGGNITREHNIPFSLSLCQTLSLSQRHISFFPSHSFLHSFPLFLTHHSLSFSSSLSHYFFPSYSLPSIVSLSHTLSLRLSRIFPFSFPSFAYYFSLSLIPPPLSHYFFSSHSFSYTHYFSFFLSLTLSLIPTLFFISFSLSLVLFHTLFLSSLLLSSLPLSLSLSGGDAEGLFASSSSCCRLYELRQRGRVMQQAVKVCRLSTKTPAQPLQETDGRNSMTGRQKLPLKLVTGFCTSALTQTDTCDDESHAGAFSSALGKPRCHLDGKCLPNVPDKNVPSHNPVLACSV